MLNNAARRAIGYDLDRARVARAVEVLSGKGVCGADGLGKHRANQTHAEDAGDDR